MNISFKIGKNYAVDLTALEACSFTYNFVLFDAVADFGVRGDHCPRLHLNVCIMNLTLLDLDIYNTSHHKEEMYLDEY